MTRRTMLAAAVLVALAIAVFQPVGRHEFLNYDDEDYVTMNHQVAAGLTARGIVWAFTSTRSSNWHPLTWISHMLDVQLFGMDAGKHHLTNLALHIVNALLLLLVLSRMTGALWPSALAATVFAVHPLHVESVAWVAERKDVLSGLFWMLAIGFYLRYVRNPGVARFVPVFACLALGLAAKPMLVTLPFVLLLLDFWPLQRLAWPAARGAPTPASRLSPWRLVVEKVPLLALCAVSSVVTYWAQDAGGAVNVIRQQQFGLRVGNALVSYGSYLIKTIWPARLAVFYPLPTAPYPLWQLAAAALLLTGVTVAVARLAGKRPYLATGWLWYAGTLVPVIGLVQVGGQAMADRYMYLPLVGLAVMAAWALAEASRGPRAGALASVTAVCLVVLAVTAGFQVVHWRDSISLFRRALEVTEGNYIAHANLGRALVEAGKTDDGIAHLRKSLAITVDPGVLSNLGAALLLQGKSAEALRYFTRALELGPSPAILTNIGIILLQQGDLAEAAARFREALLLQPGHAVAHNNLGVALLRLGRREEAVAEYRTAIRLQPQYPGPIINLGDALLAEGESREAADLYRRVLQFDPGNVDARARLEKASGERH